MNRYGNPDTLILDPALKYDLIVNTTPRIEKKDISIVKNTHNTIEVDAGQGDIKIRFLNATKPYQIEARIMTQDDPKTLNVQKIGETDKYLVGWYNIEVLTLPRTYISVKVEQSQKVNVDIKAPGWVKYCAVSGITVQIFTANDNGTWDWVCNLDDGYKTGNHQLQPGAYRVVYRQKNLKKSEYTLEKDFRINSNKTTSLQL